MSTTHSSHDGRLQVSIPRGWTAVEPDLLEEDEVFAAMRLDRREYAANFNISRVPEPKSAAALLAQHRQSVEHVAGFIDLGAGEFAVGDVDVHWTGYIREFEEEGLTLAVAQYFLVAGDQAYSVACFCLPEDIQERIEDFHAMVDSLTFS